MWAVLLPAIAVAVVGICVSLPGRTCAGDAVKSVIRVCPVPINTVVGSEYVSVWGVAAGRSRDADGISRAIGDRGKPEPSVISENLADTVSEAGGQERPGRVEMRRGIKYSGMISV